MEITQHLQIIKQTSSLGTLLIKPVDKSLARELIIKNHYSHKWNASFGMYNFGIFKAEEPDKCLGVAAYGYMKSPKAKIFTHPNPNAWVCELNRMWIDDMLGYNAETILIGNSLKLLRKMDTNIVAVQSFADGRLGCGTIYKASNFKYYGFHYTTFLQNTRTQEIQHKQIFEASTCMSAFVRSNIGYLLGDYKVFQVKTYRYIYTLDKKVQFKFKEKPYPSYDKGMMSYEWKRDIPLLKERLHTMIDKL